MPTIMAELARDDNTVRDLGQLSVRTTKPAPGSVRVRRWSGSVGLLAEHDLVPARHTGALRTAPGRLLLGLLRRCGLGSRLGGLSSRCLLGRTRVARLRRRGRARGGRTRLTGSRICRTRGRRTLLDRAHRCWGSRRSRTLVRRLSGRRRRLTRACRGRTLVRRRRRGTLVRRLTLRCRGGTLVGRLRRLLAARRLGRTLGCVPRLLVRARLHLTTLGERVRRRRRTLLRGSELRRRLRRPLDRANRRVQRRRLLDRYVDQRRLFIRIRHRVHAARRRARRSVLRVATEPAGVAVARDRWVAARQADRVLEAGLVANRLRDPAPATGR